MNPSMSSPVDPLEQQVSATQAYGPSVIVLVKGIAARIAAGANNPVAMVTLAHDLETHAVALGQAVVSGGPADTSFLWPGGIPIDPLTPPAVAAASIVDQRFPQAAALGNDPLAIPPAQTPVLAPEVVPTADMVPGPLETVPRPMGAVAPRDFLVEDSKTGEVFRERRTPSDRPPTLPPPSRASTSTPAPAPTNKKKHDHTPHGAHHR